MKAFYTWFITRDRVFKFSWIRIVSLIITGTSFVATEFSRLHLRPLFRSRGVENLDILNSIGNLGGIVVQIFFGMALLNPNRIQSYRLAAFFAVGFVVYEFLQTVLPRGTFDWNDVLATVIGYGVSVGVIWVLWTLMPEKKEVAHR